MKKIEKCNPQELKCSFYTNKMIDITTLQLKIIIYNNDNNNNESFI